MRCPLCGWVVETTRCPCGATPLRDLPQHIPVGTRVVFRPGRGPSMNVWGVGEVLGHVGRIHRVEGRGGFSWCEGNDLLPSSLHRDDTLNEGTRVWGLWLDGRWYPGTIDGSEEHLRHILWDDGDSMWVESTHVVLLVTESTEPALGTIVVARHWNGEEQPARIEGQEGERYRVTFRDGEEAWVTPDEMVTFPPNPFLG